MLYESICELGPSIFEVNSIPIAILTSQLDSALKTAIIKIIGSKNKFIDLRKCSKYYLKIINLSIYVKLDAGGKPSTWFPPKGHVEHI